MSVQLSNSRGRTTCRILCSVLFVALLYSSSVRAQDRIGPLPGATRGEWKLQHPIVISSAEMGPRDRLLNLFPMGFIWLEDVPVIAAVKDPKVSPVLLLWKENTNHSWTHYAEIPGISFPSVFSINGKAIGVVGSAGTDVSGGYGSAIHFLRMHDGKTGKPYVLSPASEDGSRVTVSTVEVSGDTIFVFLLRETRGNRQNDLLFATSTDGGLSWSDTTKIGETTMHEDSSHVRGLCFGDRHVMRFLSERESNFTYRTTDAGKVWEKEPFRVQDGLGDTRRLPLGTIESGGEVGVVYLAFDPRNRRQARYSFTRSSDQGKTWSKGISITQNVKMDDPSLIVQLASAGNRIAFSYIENVGSWTKGEIENHIIVSQDDGKTWVREPLNKDYNGVMLFSALSGAPDGSRFLYGTAIRMKNGGKSRCFLVVQEYSDRNPGEEDLALVKHLVADLGDQKFAVREAASKRLAALGTSARAELLKAAESEDLEAATRAKALLELIFPECLKLRIDD